MDCDRCRLRTEQYLLDSSDILVLRRCLGATKSRITRTYQRRPRNTTRQTIANRFMFCESKRWQARLVSSPSAGANLAEGGDGLLVAAVNDTIERKNTVSATGIDIPGMVIDYLISVQKR